MKYCIVEIKTQTATFRNPEFQNFHKTLPLLPPTTMVGIAGAAMGLSPKSAQDFFEKSDFVMGTYFKNHGASTDLWKFNDFKERSIILKEILFHNKAIIVFGSEDNSKIKILSKSFLDPVFSLTLGNSDSLAKVVKVFQEYNIVKSKTVSNCLIEGDVVEEVLSNASNGLEFSIYSTSDPIAIDLPTRFLYTDEYGLRKVSQRKQFSFITTEMKLNVEKQGVLYGGIFIPLFNY